jgi:hypothetical protein
MTPEQNELLDKLLDGELDNSEREQAARLREENPEFDEAIRQHELIASVLAEDADAPVPLDFKDVVRRKLKNRRIVRISTRLIAAAAVLMIGAVLFVAITKNGNTWSHTTNGEMTLYDLASKPLAIKAAEWNDWVEQADDGLTRIEKRLTADASKEEDEGRDDVNGVGGDEIINLVVDWFVPLDNGKNGTG